MAIERIKVRGRTVELKNGKGAFGPVSISVRDEEVTLSFQDMRVYAYVGSGTTQEAVRHAFNSLTSRVRASAAFTVRDARDTKKAAAEAEEAALHAARRADDLKEALKG
jgi:hypothetical protein